MKEKIEAEVKTLYLYALLWHGDMVQEGNIVKCSCEYPWKSIIPNKANMEGIVILKEIK